MRLNTFLFCGLMYITGVCMATYALGQEMSLTEHVNTTGSHFATLKVYNEVGSKYPRQTFSTSEGDVVVVYRTYVKKSGCHPLAPPNAPLSDCPDHVTVETPEGVVAIPQEVFVDEYQTVEIKLYRYVGM